jgi:hypothetical protein
MHPFISVVGAAWILMGQNTFSETRVIGQTEVAPTSGDSEPAPVRERGPAPVTIVELRREINQHSRSAVKGSKREYRGRWMVGWPNGFWRQQAYGPGRSLRKPILIAPHTAGPQGAPLIPPMQRVYVWRNSIALADTVTGPMQLWPFLRVHSNAAGAGDAFIRARVR